MKKCSGESKTKTALEAAKGLKTINKVETCSSSFPASCLEVFCTTKAIDAYIQKAVLNIFYFL
jgi:hypothetical protein